MSQETKVIEKHDETEPVRRELQSVILAEASDWQVVLSQETSLKVL